MSLDERRKRLKDLKSRTKCQACSKVGHWAGDPECPMKGKGKGSDKKKTGGAYLAAVDESDCTSIDSSDDSVPEHGDERHGYMVDSNIGSNMQKVKVEHFNMNDSSGSDSDLSASGFEQVKMEEVTAEECQHCGCVHRPVEQCSTCKGSLRAICECQVELAPVA